MSEYGIMQVKKRDGRIVEFTKKRISDAIAKAAQAAEDYDEKTIQHLTDKVISVLEFQFDKLRIPTVEDVQNVVETVLIKSGHDKVAKAYILYRNKRAEMRRSEEFLKKVKNIIDGYVGMNDWRVKENSNAGYAVSGLQAHISGAVIAEYALTNIYPLDIAEAHRNADFHIHDLSIGTFAGYCAGWSLRLLLEKGFNGIPGKVSAKPAKHLNAALGQITNFFGTLQNEWAGAQAFSSFDTYLAPFVRHDNLEFKEVKQAIQEFIFGVNQTSRWGNQVPFTNITMDWIVPEDLKDQKIIIGGKRQDTTYSDYQKEMDLINKAFMEVMMEGDMDHRIFTFPIPTYNITKDFDWESENAQLLFDMTAKYGTPYFQNFINSSLSPSDVRSMCCRLQLDIRELKSKTGGLFGSGESTGSIGVVTINLPRIGYLAKNKVEFFEKLSHLMVLAKNSLELKRKEVTKNLEYGLLPYTKEYLGSLRNHFSTIGICGMHECSQNFLSKDKGIEAPEGRAFALEVLNYIRNKLQEFQEETGNIYNLEATPAEGTSFRLAKHDKKRFPNIIASGSDDAPFYTNSSQLPVNHTNDIFEALKHQDELQCCYTGGTVLHGFVGEKISDWEACRNLIKKIAYNFKLPYFTITPTFSICPVHGYIAGEHQTCPHEHSEADLNKYGVDVEEEEQKIEVKIE